MKKCKRSPRPGVISSPCLRLLLAIFPSKNPKKRKWLAGPSLRSFATFSISAGRGAAPRGRPALFRDRDRKRDLRHGPGGPSFWTDLHRPFTLQIVMENNYYTRRDHDWGGQNWPCLGSFLRSRSRQKPCPQATFGRKKAAPPRRRAVEIH